MERGINEAINLAYILLNKYQLTIIKLASILYDLSEGGVEEELLKDSSSNSLQVYNVIKKESMEDTLRENPSSLEIIKLI